MTGDVSSGSRAPIRLDHRWSAAIAGSYVGGTPSRATLEALADEIDSGRVRPSVQHVYRLDEAAEAQVRVAEGHVRGKLVISVGAVTDGASRVSGDQRTRAGAARAGS